MLRFASAACLTGLAIVLITYTGADNGLFILPSFLWLTVLLPGVTSVILFHFLARVIGTPSFTFYYLLSVAGKILGFCIFMVIIIVLDKKNAPGNVVIFMISYLAFTGLEVGFLFQKTTLQKKN